MALISFYSDACCCLLSKRSGCRILPIVYNLTGPTFFAGILSLVTALVAVAIMQSKQQLQTP